MTYNPNVPVASQSPSQFPPQGQANFGRLRTLVNVDHQFNNSAAGNDGYHKVVHWINQAGSFRDGTPAVVAGTGQLYTKTINFKDNNSASTMIFPMYKNAGGTEWILTPIGAYVNFDGTGGNGSKTIRQSVNVSTVTRTSTGTYTITFQTAFTTDRYAIVVSGSRSGSGQQVFGQIRSGTYTDNVKTTQVRVEFYSDNGNAQDVECGSVICVGF